MPKGKKERKNTVKTTTAKKKFRINWRNAICIFLAVLLLASVILPAIA